MQLKFNLKTVAIANVSSIVFSYLVSVLSLGRILISDIVVADLFMHSFSDMILLYLAALFLHQRSFWMMICMYMKRSVGNR